MSPSPTSASKPTLVHVVGFSGHRHLADPAGVAQAIGRELRALTREPPGEWSALSSVAAGADLLFVQQALGYGLKWNASLPLPIAEFERDFPSEEWRVVRSLLERAGHTHIVTGSGTRDEAYLAGGLDVVNRCSALLVVWDGLPARGKGGTADVVAYARSVGRPIVIIHPDTQAVLRERLS
jgi:hypothetical protein